MSNLILLSVCTIAKLDEFTRLVMLGDTYCSFNIYISINFYLQCFHDSFNSLAWFYIIKPANPTKLS